MQKTQVQPGQEYLRKARRCGNRRHNPGKDTCGKRGDAETAGITRANTPAERGEGRKPHVPSEREHLRKEVKGGNRTYNPGARTCGKRGDAETAGTTRANTPAERGEGRKPHVQSGQECVRKARRCGNRRYNPGEYTCGKRRRAGTTRTIWARVPAESEEMRKAHVQPGRAYLRKEAKGGNRRYNPGKSTCGKRGDAETACTIWTRVRAESEEMRKPHVQSGQELLRKEAKGGNRMYNPGKSTCGK